MDYTVHDSGSLRELELRGQMTFEADGGFREIMAGWEAGGVADCVLNLAAVDYIDSAGLGLLVLANNAARRTGVTFRLKHPRGQVRELIENSEFHTIIPCEF
ncbi:STAS domain-containing protein [Azospirillum sp. BE72]|uniref:STAS domain-containing protein n=1 Tax=Azospirillum sp. BE72 TaxID=2817776 RepID=UPI002857DF31|nr:STAS domain-containing protein [Azospirillum sp. BE72]MDR6771889.1 anti-anti-sigma factor [Azospirillum sp. BE72]